MNRGFNKLGEIKNRNEIETRINNCVTMYMNKNYQSVIDMGKWGIFHYSELRIGEKLAWCALHLVCLTPFCLWLDSPCWY